MTAAAGTSIRIGLVGLGKIARDQHIPSLSKDPAYQIAAVATTSHASSTDLPAYPTLQAMLDAVPDLDAVTFCTPPQGRYALAHYALQRGKHVMLEKPPGITPTEVEDLTALAQARGVALFASWHSRAAAAVGPAQAWLEHRNIRSARVRWLESVRKWHPGQKWIWQAGGLGVFDPGINALSMVTRLMPRPLFVTSAVLTFPANCETPIAAELTLQDSAQTPVDIRFDFRQPAGAGECWEIQIVTDDGTLELQGGGASMRVNGQEVALTAHGEYPALYRHFANLVRGKRVDVDLSPLKLVADAFLVGRRLTTDPFED